MQPDSIARKREFDKDAVSQRVMLLFGDKGYEATSIRDLLNAIGINSSTCEMFGDKRGVFLFTTLLFQPFDLRLFSRDIH